MNQTSNEIYLKIQKLGRDVKEELRRQGIIVPVKKKDGSIQVGHFRIKKTQTGFYSVVDPKNEVIIDRINLPQTAAVLANRLALGKWLDDNILTADTRYGFALFDEELHKQLAEKNLKSNNVDKADMMYTKSAIAKHKKEQYKFEINKGFEKLMRFR